MSFLLWYYEFKNNRLLLFCRNSIMPKYGKRFFMKNKKTPSLFLFEQNLILLF
jgi:hypothetical protein